MVAVVQDTAAGFQSGELTAGRSLRQIIWSRLRRDRIAMICLVILIVYYLLAIFGPVVAGFVGIDPYKRETWPAPGAQGVRPGA